MSQLKTFLKTTLVALGVLSTLAVAQAAVGIDSDLRPEYAPESYNELNNPDGTAAENFDSLSVNYIIADIIVVVLQLAGVLAIFMIVANAFTYVRAFGEEETIQKAKKGLTWAIIGLLVVILSYAIVENVIRITLSIDPSASSSEATSVLLHLLA